jgi:FkbM family methyltransferase
MGIGAGSSVNSSGERAVINKLKELYAITGETLCVFDVGSNQGQFLQLVSDELIGIPFQVHCFEPEKYSFEILFEKARTRSNVTLNNFGLGKESGEYKLFSDENGSGLASLSKRKLDHLGIHFVNASHVRIERLDSYCSDHSIQNIDLLKIDVEGHELDVLQGGLRMIQSKKIRMISFEFGGCNIDSRTYFQDYWYFFQENEFGNIFRITPSGHLHLIQQYKESDEQFRTTNFLVLSDQEPTGINSRR